MLKAGELTYFILKDHIQSVVISSCSPGSKEELHNRDNQQNSEVLFGVCLL